MSLTDDEYSDSCAKSTLLTNKRTIVKQSCTDLPGIFPFLLSIFSWLSPTLFVLYTLEEHESFFEKLNRDHEKYTLFKYSHIYGLFILPSVIYLWLYFMAVRFLTKLTIVLTILSTTIFWITVFYAYINTPIENHTLSTLVLVVILISVTVHMILFYLSMVEIDYISKVLKNSCKAMLWTPSFLIISILQMGCVAFIACVSWVVMRKVYYDKGPSESKTIFTVLYGILSLWLLSVIYNFGQMILYKTFTTSCRTADKQSIPYGIALTCAASHFRYHMGTAAFGSTIFTIVPLLLSICNSSKMIVDNIRKRSITLICLPFILGSSTDNAFIACAIYGKNFYNSMKNSFKIVLQDPVKFTTTRLVTNWILLFGLIVPLVLTVSAAMEINYNFSYHELRGFFKQRYCYEIIGILSCILATIFLNSLHAAVSSILLCSLEALDCGESNESHVVQIQRFNNDVEDANDQNFSLE